MQGLAVTSLTCAYRLYYSFTGPKPISYIILFVLEDMYEKNGSIVVPGSHQSGRFTNREFTNYKIVNAKAGDVLMLDNRTGTEPLKIKHLIKMVNKCCFLVGGSSNRLTFKINTK